MAISLFNTFVLIINWLQLLMILQPHDLVNLCTISIGELSLKVMWKYGIMNKHVLSNKAVKNGGKFSYTIEQ
jgi:hypothetical protein